MKISKISILFIMLALTGFNVSSSFDFNNPSVTVSSEKVEETEKGKVVILSLSLCSSANLESFQITPDKPGLNADSELKYVFNTITKQASVNYYFSVPENVTEVSFTMTLNDTDRKTIKIREVVIN